jgi:two-component system, OmpR family, phosphate regulon response regulator PhoB
VSNEPTSRILLVDDEEDMAGLVEMCLDSLHVELVRATRFSEAVEVARLAPVHLVLLDLALGEEDGLHILPALRARPELEGVSVVAFTAHDSRRAEAFELGITDFVARPFSPAELQKTVRKHLPNGLSHPVAS